MILIDKTPILYEGKFMRPEPKYKIYLDGGYTVRTLIHEILRDHPNEWGGIDILKANHGFEGWEHLEHIAFEMGKITNTFDESVLDLLVNRDHCYVSRGRFGNPDACDYRFTVEG